MAVYDPPKDQDLLVGTMVASTFSFENKVGQVWHRVAGLLTAEQHMDYVVVEGPVNYFILMDVINWAKGGSSGTRYDPVKVADMDDWDGSL